MLEHHESVARPRMKEIVLEAARSLAQLDSVRLEELAASCDVLNRELQRADAQGKQRLANEVLGSRREMDLLASVLEATRANLRVLRHLSAMRTGNVGYAPGADQN